MKFPEKTNLQGQKGDWQLPGAGVGTGTRGIFGGAGRREGSKAVTQLSELTKESLSHALQTGELCDIQSIPQ